MSGAKRRLKVAVDFLGSYALSCILFLLLLVLTFLGTVEQIESGLYEVQQRYFQSLVVVHWLFGALPVPLPGAFLLLGVLLVNLVIGGIVRARRDWTRWGVLAAHIGIVVLLAGGFAKFLYAETGHLTLFEGEQANQFESYYDWEAVLAAHSEDEAVEYLIPEGQLAALSPGGEVTYTHPDLPFRVRFTNHLRNGRPRLESGAVEMHAVALERGPEYRLPAVQVHVAEGGDVIAEDWLWGGQRMPLVFESDGQTWTIDLRRKQTQLPFTVALRDFTVERHPGTHLPKSFVSEVTRIENGVREEVTISMNKPMRHRGYTLYQSGWGPQDAAPGERLYTVLAVSHNPVERWPLYASVIIMLGLIYHFVVKLLRHLVAVRSAPEVHK